MDCKNEGLRLCTHCHETVPCAALCPVLHCALCCKLIHEMAEAVSSCWKTRKGRGAWEVQRQVWLASAETLLPVTVRGWNTRGREYFNTSSHVTQPAAQLL